MIRTYVEKIINSALIKIVFKILLSITVFYLRNMGISLYEAERQAEYSNASSLLHAIFKTK